MDELMQLVCKGAVFVICADTIIRFRPREVYEKYLRVLVGIMLAAIIFEPVCELVSKGRIVGIKGRMNSLQAQMEQEAEWYLERAQELNGELENVNEEAGEVEAGE